MNLEEMSLTELKDLAKENNIKNISKLKKDELIEMLSQILNQNNSIKREEKVEKEENNKKAFNF